MTKESTIYQHDVWRYLILAGLVLLPMVVLAWLPRIPQDPAYHIFADTREFFRVPNFFDVASNAPFLLIGLAGVAFVLGSEISGARGGWLVLFAGVSFVSAGSAYYHLDPSNESLLWDRLPMTVGFMGLFAALLVEHLNRRLGELLLIPLVLLGVGSVVYWSRYDDLRLYAWVQFFPLLIIPLLLGLFRSRFTHQWMLLAAIGLYALAKIFELSDIAVFNATGHLVSGHTLKHILAAGSCLTVLLMLQRRKTIFALVEPESVSNPVP